MAGRVLLDMTPCPLVNSYQHFGGACCLHLQGQCRDMCEILLDFLDSEDGGHWNVDSCVISFGWFLGVWIWCAHVLEHAVFSIFVGGVRGSLSVHHQWRWNRLFWSIGTYNSDAGESPKRKDTTFSTWRKFEIKNVDGYLPILMFASQCIIIRFK